jgi:hypothetical protein
VHSRQLEDVLSAFVEAAALALQAEIEAGAEVAFELESGSSRGGRTPLYSYRPLTAEFIAERVALLSALRQHAEAAQLLGDFAGLQRYLIARGVPAVPSDRRVAARAGLRALLEDVFEEQTDFVLRAERLRQSLERLDGAASMSANEVTIVTTLHGLTIASQELTLTTGLTIARPEAVRGLPGGLGIAGAGGRDDHLLVMFSAEGADAHEVVADGTDVLLDLLRALRLFGDGRVTLGSLAWARIGAGAWNPLALCAGGRPHGMLLVSAEQEDELRAFCNLVSRRAPDQGRLAWALERFEMGCERGSELEALSDNLLALRALLADQVEGLAQSTVDELLAARLAALCATAEARGELASRVLRAQALERGYIAGTAVEHHGEQALMRELAGHLQALLRDVVCGHLGQDLAATADELLALEQQPSGHEPMLGADSTDADVDQAQQVLV